MAAFFATVFMASFFVLPGEPAEATQATTRPDPFYGTWSDGLSPTPDAAGAELDRLAGAGVGLMRQYVFWDRIETSPGVFDWRRMDELVAAATARGVTVLPTLLYTPSFYSSKPEGSTSNSLFPPSDPETMARFAEAMVRRYGPNGQFWCPPPTVPSLPPSCRSPYVPIKAWEVWNEPDFPSWWKGTGGPNAAEYAALLRAVSAGIRRADSSAEVVLGALTNKGASTEGGFLDQLYALGAADDFDTITVNPYAMNVANMVAFVRGARTVADQNGDGQSPIRVTEYGWATGGTSTQLVVSESCQAALLHAGTQRLTALRTELNIRSIIQFQWRDVATTSLAWPHYAGVLLPDGTAKPSHEALRAAIGGRPAPSGLTLDPACPEERRAVDTAAGNLVADDSFNRTVSDGWGVAQIGGAYTLGTGTASSFSVAGGLGRIEVPAGTSRVAVLESTSARNVDIWSSFATDRPATATSGQLFTLFTRRRSEGTEYRMHTRLGADGAVHLRVGKANEGVETMLGEEVLVPRLLHQPAEPITVRARVTGASPTTIEVKAWASSQAQPSAWHLVRTDSESALQAAGDVGLRSSVSGAGLNGPVTFTIDTLYATSPK